MKNEMLKISKNTVKKQITCKKFTTFRQARINVRQQKNKTNRYFPSFRIRLSGYFKSGLPSTSHGS